MGDEESLKELISESQRRAALERMQVRDLDVNEIICRMNQLRQRGSDRSAESLANPFAPRLIRGSLSPILGTRINFHPEFRRLGLAAPVAEPVNLDNIPTGCVRNEPSAMDSRSQGSMMSPVFNIYGCPAGDGSLSSFYRWLSRQGSAPRMSTKYCQYPRHPYRLGLNSVPSPPYATRGLLISQFGVSSSEEEEDISQFGVSSSSEEEHIAAARDIPAIEALKLEKKKKPKKKVDQGMKQKKNPDENKLEDKDEKLEEMILVNHGKKSEEDPKGKDVNAEDKDEIVEMTG